MARGQDRGIVDVVMEGMEMGGMHRRVTRGNNEGALRCQGCIVYFDLGKMLRCVIRFKRVGENGA
jgi:hypothetical protein